LSIKHHHSARVTDKILYSLDKQLYVRTSGSLPGSYTENYYTASFEKQVRGLMCSCKLFTANS